MVKKRDLSCGAGGGRECKSGCCDQRHFVQAKQLDMRLPHIVLAPKWLDYRVFVDNYYAVAASVAAFAQWSVK